VDQGGLSRDFRSSREQEVAGARMRANGKTGTVSALIPESACARPRVTVAGHRAVSHWRRTLSLARLAERTCSRAFFPAGRPPPYGRLIRRGV